MAITILEIAPLLHSLFGVALWLIIINAICLVLAVRFEKIGDAMDSLPADSVSYRDKIRMLCLYDKVLSGIGLRLAFSLISKNPFKLHLAQPKRLFRSLSEQDEDMLLRSMTPKSARNFAAYEPYVDFRLKRHINGAASGA